MNTRSVNSAAGVILAALAQNRTPAGIALALEAAGLLMSPQAAADLASVSTDAVRVAEESVTELKREHGVSAELRARVAELEAVPATVPAAYELATRAHLAEQLRQVIDRCAKRSHQAEMPLRRDLIARGMGLLSALHLLETGSADNTEEDGEYAGYDEFADPPEGFPDEPIPYTEPAGYPAETLLARRGIRPPVSSVEKSADKLTRLLAPTQALREVPDGEHYAATHHDYRVSHDLPEMGGA